MWPTPQDYNESVQQPQACFADSELRRCRVELNHLGLPRPMTGAFASVYRLSNLSGTSWAVRCFLEHRDDMKERYAAIKNTVDGPARDLFASFEFIEKGIKVRNEWYPILKMEWVDGDSLDRYLDRHVKTRAKVASLHKQFRELVFKLKNAGIAHGDLQHGNILVTDSGLRLIDYDDMFVHALAGKVSHELGHRNFQHPDRSNIHFNADLDNFSEWVIDLSLRALVVDPDIWRDFNGGDDCLLFKHKDFKAPSESALFKYLTAHDETDLRETAQLFFDVLKLKPTRVPDFQSDARVVSQLLHLASVEEIDEAERARFGDHVSEQKLESNPVELSFVDYDRWLASVEQRKQQPSKSASRLLERMRLAATHLGKKAYRQVVSNIAPYRWARAVVDEGNREYDEGNLTEAVKLYSDAAVVLRSDKRKREIKNRAPELELLCAVLINLGYCYVRKEQPGTAAHYFREARSIASSTEYGETRLQAQLLLTATLFELDKKGETHMGNTLNPLATEINVLKGQMDTAEVLIGAVRGEREGPFGNMLTFPSMLTELGHGYLAASDYANAQSAYQAAMESCQWIKEEKHLEHANLITARAACGFSSTLVGEREVQDGINQFCQLVELENNSDILRQLIRTELRGPLRADWKYAELMRALGHNLAAKGYSEQSHLAYRAALTVLRLCDDLPNLQLKIADCLLGLGKSLDAVAVIREHPDWAKNHSADLSEHVGKIQNFAHALIVSTVVFDDNTHKNRYKCLDALVKNCPPMEQLSRIIEGIEMSELGEKLCFAELMVDFARDLKTAEQNSLARCAYAGAFKAFKRANVDEKYGASIMECLLAVGDLEVAANLLLCGGRLEDMVRLMVNVMIRENKYDRKAICDLLIKVAEIQMNRPPASVTEDEIKQTLQLLDWCAGDEVELVQSTRDRAQRWLENRQLAFAHSLVEQGKFAASLELFEKQEGPTGPNVLLVKELWIMRYLSAALIDRDRGYATVADGYAFGCAVELLNGMKDHRVLSPTFALKVAELIRNAKVPSGASRYVEAVYSIFCECGRGFEHAVLSLRDSLDPKMRSIIEKRLNIKGNEDVHLSISDGNYQIRITSPGADVSSDGVYLVSEEANEIWRLTHRIFFLIEREEYSEAIAELEKLRESSDEGPASDSLVLRGYCQSLLQDDAQAERSFKQAIRVARKNDRFRYNKATLCVYLIFLRNRDKQRYLRQLIDPTLTPRDVFKIATKVVGRTLNESDDLADVLAGELLMRAEKIEKSTLTSTKIYKAVLTIFGITNNRRRLDNVYCLDAIGKFRSSSMLLKRYIQEFGFDDNVNDLMEKLARRHIKSRALELIGKYYSEVGVNFVGHMNSAREDHLVGTLKKVLAGTVPRRMLIEVRYDLLGMYGRDLLDLQLCNRVADSIVDSMESLNSDESRIKFRVELEGIARVLAKIDSSASARIAECLVTVNEESASSVSWQADVMDQELFESTSKRSS